MAHAMGTFLAKSSISLKIQMIPHISMEHHDGKFFNLIFDKYNSLNLCSISMLPPIAFWMKNAIGVQVVAVICLFSSYLTSSGSVCVWSFHSCKKKQKDMRNFYIQIKKNLPDRIKNRRIRFTFGMHTTDKTQCLFVETNLCQHFCVFVYRATAEVWSLDIPLVCNQLHTKFVIDSNFLSWKKRWTQCALDCKLMSNISHLEGHNFSERRKRERDKINS